LGTRDRVPLHINPSAGYGVIIGTTPSTIRGQARVLVVLDQPLLAAVVRLTLEHGFCITQDASDLVQATKILAEWHPHLVVADMEIDSLELLQRIGAGAGAGTRIPVVGLTRRGDLKAKLEAFDQGVDDIMSMPFTPEELLARVLAIIRRSYGDVGLRPVLKLGEMALDILNQRVRVGPEELHLSGIEESLLYLLAANAGQVISRGEIIDTLWGADYIADSNIVDHHVRNLRAKLHDDWRKPRFIATVRGRGYCFVPTAHDVEPIPSTG